MKILLVHNFYQQRGGEDVAFESEADMLRAHGHEVALHTVHNDNIDGLWQKLRTAALIVYNPSAKNALFEKIQVFRPDIVHVHNFFPQMSPAIFDACRDAGVPA